MPTISSFPRDRHQFVDLAGRILGSAPRCGRARLVAVDGPGGAGKSVFAARLARALPNAPIVQTDDFASWQNPNDWWGRLESDVLGPLQRGESVRHQKTDWATGGLGAWRDLPPSDVVIVEGVSSSRRDVADRLSMSIWVESPADIRLMRGLERDGEDARPNWDRWMAAEDVFFAQDGARDRAHLIVDGSPSETHDPEAVFFASTRVG